MENDFAAAGDGPRAWLKPFLAPLKPTVREVISMSAFVNLLALAAPIFTLQVYDRVVGSGGINTLWALVIGMVVVVVFDIILKQARSKIMQTVALRVDVIVGRQMFDKLMNLPLNILEIKPANYWQALFRDVDTVRNTLSGASAILICDLPFAVLFLGLIWVIATPLFWVLMFILPIFLFVAYRSGTVVAAANNAENETSISRDQLIAEMIIGRTTIKALALDRAMRPLWEDKHVNNIEQSVSRGTKTDFYTNLGQSLTMTTTVIMTTIGAWHIIQQELTMGALIATNMLSGRLLGPLNQLVGQWRNYNGFKEAVDRLGEVFSQKSERMHSEVTLEKPRGELVIEGLTFAYNPDVAPAVENIDVRFEPGGLHALVGRNGSGKSTLLKLIQGLYAASSGRVLIDGADIAQFSRAELATWMGYVPEETVLFAGTVRENISHRFPNASDEQVVEASKQAGVHQFIIDLPDGYATEIGEAGGRLSGGQRQRIAIARALLGNPAILLLDEPSASLDRQAEHALQETLIEISRTRSVIVVTHSPILLSICDDILALDKGKKALSGPAKTILPKLFNTRNETKTEIINKIPQESAINQQKDVSATASQIESIANNSQHSQTPNPTKSESIPETVNKRSSSAPKPDRKSPQQGPDDPYADLTNNKVNNPRIKLQKDDGKES